MRLIRLPANVDGKPLHYGDGKPAAAFLSPLVVAQVSPDTRDYDTHCIVTDRSRRTLRLEMRCDKFAEMWLAALV